MIPTVKFVLFIVLVGIVYNIESESIPDGSSQPLKLKALLCMIRGADNMLHFLDRMRIVDYLDAKRRLTELGTLMMNRHTEGVQTEDIILEGVPVRVYRPDGWSDVTSGPAMVYYHGGGWSTCNIDTHDAVTAYFALKVNMLVISVEYRLNPEFTQKEGLDDCVTVTKHLITHAEQYNVNPNRVVIAGDSAGGNYAAAVSLLLRDEKFQPMPAVQLLIYPAVQAIDLRLPSYQQNANGPMLTTNEMLWYKSIVCFGDAKYIPDFEKHLHVPDGILMDLAKRKLSHDQIPDENKYEPYQPHAYNTGASTEIWERLKDRFLDPYMNPLMAEDHSNLPRAYIFTGQYDLIRDEGYIYAGVLRKARVEVTHVNSPVGWHGMINLLKDLKDSAQVMDHMCTFLKDTL